MTSSSNHLDRGKDPVEEICKILLDERPLSEVLDKVLHLANSAMPGPTEASITLFAGEEPSTAAFTAVVASALDERQYEADHGPCLHAAQAGHHVRIRDMDAESRWPVFTAAAIERGVQSSLSVPLPVQRQMIGAVNFYSADFDGFDGPAVQLGEELASHAAVAVANARRYTSALTHAAQLREAMASRSVIEQAKGIMMATQQCDAHTAFEILVKLSQESGKKLRVVAQTVVDETARR